MHRCPLCHRSIAADLLMCGPHWARVPLQLRTRVLGLYKLERGSEAHRSACLEAVHYVSRLLHPEPPRAA